MRNHHDRLANPGALDADKGGSGISGLGLAPRAVGKCSYGNCGVVCARVATAMQYGGRLLASAAEVE